MFPLHMKKCDMWNAEIFIVDDINVLTSKGRPFVRCALGQITAHVLAEAIRSSFHTSGLIENSRQRPRFRVTRVPTSWQQNVHN